MQLMEDNPDEHTVNHKQASLLSGLPDLITDLRKIRDFRLSSSLLLFPKAVSLDLSYVMIWSKADILA